jgi:glycosyltransferase involved in cell wall biosynthesis
MRVAFLTRAYGPAGGPVGRHVQALARGVVDAGGGAEVLLHAIDNRELPSAEGDVSITRFPPLGVGEGYAFSKELWAHLRSHGLDYDLLHAHGESALPVLLMARRTRPRLIFTPHYYATAPRRVRGLVQGRRHRLDRRVLSQAERVLCVSRTEALQVRRYAPHARVQVIPNGCDADAIAAARPFHATRRVILSIDPLTRWSGVHRIISALPALAPSYVLVITGQGRAREALAAHADYLRVADRVLFVGAVGDDQLHRWLRTACVVVTLSEEGLWGGTLLAAACAGAPVLASDLLAYREAAVLTGDHSVAFVSRRASPFAVADAVRQLAASGARSRVARVPTWHDMATATIALYRELMREAGASATALEVQAR